MHRDKKSAHTTFTRSIFLFFFLHVQCVCVCAFFRLNSCVLVLCVFVFFFRNFPIYQFSIFDLSPVHLSNIYWATTTATNFIRMKRLAYIVTINHKICGTQLRYRAAFSREIENISADRAKKLRVKFGIFLSVSL